MDTIASPPPRSDAPRLATLEFVSPTMAEIRRPLGLGARLTAPLLFALFVALILAMSLVTIDRVISAPARVVGSVPNILVQPLEASIVRSFEVRVNQVVRRGDVLARLDPTFTSADLAALTAQEDSIAAEVARLNAEATDSPFVPGPGIAMALQAAIHAQRLAERQFRVEGQRQRIRSLEETIQRSQSELARLRERANIATQIEAMRRDLERVQIGSRLNSLIATDGRIEVQRAISVAEGQIRTAERDIAGAQADLEAFTVNWRTQVAQDLALKRRDLSDAREALNKAQLRRDLIEIRAPVDAVVLEVGKTSPGSVLAAGEMLLTLVPSDAPLEVQAEVNPRDLGYIGIGDRVALKFMTFPFVRHGIAHGRVESISQDTTRDPTTPSAPSYYRARIAITEMRMRNMPPDFRLLPGMPVEADIIVGERTPIRYLFERALPSLLTGFREP